MSKVARPIRRRRPRHTRIERFRLNGAPDRYRSDATIGALQVQAERLAVPGTSQVYAPFPSGDVLFHQFGSSGVWGFPDGFGPVRFETTGGTPGGLNTTDEFWVTVEPGSDFRLEVYGTQAEALSRTNKISILSNGAGSQTIVSPSVTPSTASILEQLSEIGADRLRALQPGA